MSQLGGAVRSSSMISLQRSMHSSQMYTPGPAISFLTWRCDLPQKLQRSCSLESVGRAIRLSPPGYPKLVLRDHPVNDAVFLGLFGRHEVVALRVGADLGVVLLGVLGDDLVQALTDVDDLLGVDLDIRRLALEAGRHLVDENLGVGQRHALALGATGEQQRAHAHRDADADR